MPATPLRVLLVHNYYRSSAPSGEDAVFENERRLLESSGLFVTSYIRRNDDIDDSHLHGQVTTAIGTVWSQSAYRELTRLIERERPHVAHFHNTFPQISPSGYLACRSAGVPVVQTLHNYRLVCAGALLQRDGKPCELCLDGGSLRGLLPGLRHRCYRKSLPATSALTAMLAVHRLLGSYSRAVDRYIALTHFAAGRLSAGGLPADRITVKPNFLPEPPVAGDGLGGYAIYVGRLSNEKGVRTLVEAWREPGLPPLRLLGDGPLRSELETQISQQRLPIEIMGNRPRPEVLSQVGGACLQIIPSECYEGFPMVILEALAKGTPLVVSRIGSINEIVEDDVTGVKFSPGDPTGLARCVRDLAGNPTRLSRLREQARKCFEDHYTADKNLERILAIYRSVV